MDIQTLNELHVLALRDAERFPQKRLLFADVMAQRGKHFVGIMGPRGVGKTVLLKQLAQHVENSFYISADAVPDLDLFEVAKVLHQTRKIQVLLVDEIHFIPDFARQLKKIYDFLPVRVFFSSSVSLAMYQSQIDLSRRVHILQLYPFSFREYVYFMEKRLVPPLTLHDISHKKWQPEHLLYDYLFYPYLKGGNLPFSLEEENVFSLLQNVLKKIIYSDIPAVYNVRIVDLQIIEKMVRFIGKSAIDGINITSLSKNLGITKYKAEQFVQMLENSFVLHVVWPTGTNVLREPKIVLQLPYRLLYREWDEALGGIREDFAVEMFRMANLECYYLKSTRGKKTPDYFVTENDDHFIVEIGGKGKGFQQFKGVKTGIKMVFSDSNTIDGNKRPLMLLGFLA